MGRKKRNLLPPPPPPKPKDDDEEEEQVFFECSTEVEMELNSVVFVFIHGRIPKTLASCTEDVRVRMPCT